jgi:hypothetical protein
MQRVVVFTVCCENLKSNTKLRVSSEVRRTKINPVASCNIKFYNNLLGHIDGVICKERGKGKVSGSTDFFAKCI